MAQRVASSELPLESPRWGFPYHEVPETLPNVTYGWPNTKAEQYGLLLDCVYEMADQMVTSNGGKIEDAIDTSIKLQGWNILPKHRRLLAVVYHQPDDLPIRFEAMINRLHLYSIGTRRGERRFDIEVVAGNRRSAVAIAHRNGFMAYNVNMTG